MAQTQAKRRSTLPESGEQVLLRVGTGQRELEFLAPISKRTISAIECTLSLMEFERYLPNLQPRQTIGFKSAQHINVDVSYTRDIGGVYRFATTLSAKLKGDTAILILEMPTSVRKSQRRRDFRLPLAAKVSLRPSNARQVYSANLINLSATGAMVVSSEQIKVDVQLEFSIDESNSDASIGIIDAVVIDCVRTPSQDSGGKLSYTLRLEFNDGTKSKLPTKQREEIARYVFEQQRQMLRLRTLVGDSHAASKPHGLGGLLDAFRR
jgi:c-di-GMP-binding flagellar brake protein YcgR